MLSIRDTILYITVPIDGQLPYRELFVVSIIKLSPWHQTCTYYRPVSLTKRRGEAGGRAPWKYFLPPSKMKTDIVFMHFSTFRPLYKYFLPLELISPHFSTLSGFGPEWLYTHPCSHFDTFVCINTVWVRFLYTQVYMYVHDFRNLFTRVTWSCYVYLYP